LCQWPVPSGVTLSVTAPAFSLIAAGISFLLWSLVGAAEPAVCEDTRCGSDHACGEERAPDRRLLAPDALRESRGREAHGVPLRAGARHRALELRLAHARPAVDVQPL